MNHSTTHWLKHTIPWLAFLWLSHLSTTTQALEITLEGELGLGGRYFWQAPQRDQQTESDFGVFGTFGVFIPLESGDQLTFKTRGRLDSADENRNYAVIEEAYWLHLQDSSEWRLGIDVVTNSITEAIHLVDIINQTNDLEPLSEERKIGQPMLRYTQFLDESSFDVMLLLHHMPKRWRHPDGRPSSAIEVTNDQYEQTSEERLFQQMAFNWNQTLDNSDIAISGFSGSARLPTLRMVDGTMTAYYPHIQQLGLTWQQFAGDSTLKSELIYRWNDLNANQQRQNYAGAVLGAEHTFYAALGQATDLTLVGEYGWDERQAKANALFAFQNDLLLGMRLEFNDADGAELFVGATQDLAKSQDPGFQFSASRRQTANDKIQLNALSLGEFDKYITVEWLHYW